MRYGLCKQCASLAHGVIAVPQNENKFKCPCHGSQYNFQGKVVRGPAPLSLALAHMEVKDDLVTFSPWCASTSLRIAAPPALLSHHLLLLTSIESDLEFCCTAYSKFIVSVSGGAKTHALK